MLANERRVSPATRRQALSALLFPCNKEVLGQDLPWMTELDRPTASRRIPAVLTREDVQAVPAHMEGTTALLARLLYGAGMRLMEGRSLRVKDGDFSRAVVSVREGRGSEADGGLRGRPFKVFGPLPHQRERGGARVVGFGCATLNTQSQHETRPHPCPLPLMRERELMSLPLPLMRERASVRTLTGLGLRCCPGLQPRVVPRRVISHSC
jgi:hypothetical protein